MSNHWNDRFSAEEYVYGEVPNVFVKEQAHFLRGNKKIAAFAEGEGRNAVYLAQHNHEVTTFDFAENGLQKTKKLANRFNVEVETIQTDLIHDSLPVEKFDGAIMVFGHFLKKDQKTVLDKIIASVKSGGTIMFEVYSEDQLRYLTGGPKVKEMLYHPNDVLSWVYDYNVLHFFYGEQERVEGLLHTGKGHVIQVIIQK
ncbi:class I SAM-dependent methyltransferase [Bacillus piscicola]|uniref:class I SAM-dependent methyltransferase n=1 Tax=Bacillus piscicola TaxID=1632684 RepID=UPI001F08BBF9|nr:class I SAM-dependent methyltransferase [Bacillus piscicola]